MLRLLVTAVLILSTLASCAIPEGGQDDPEGLHFAVIRARLAGDSDALWALLHPDTRAEIRTLRGLEKETLAVIAHSYPESYRKSAVDALAEGWRARTDDAKALFGKLAKLRPAGELGFPQRLGARVKELQDRGGSTLVESWAGDVTIARQGEDGRWYMELPAAEKAALAAAIEQARANLARAKANAARFEGRQPAPSAHRLP